MTKNFSVHKFLFFFVYTLVFRTRYDTRLNKQNGFETVSSFDCNLRASSIYAISRQSYLCELWTSLFAVSLKQNGELSDLLSVSKKT